MSCTEILTILAILSGPVIAVQLTRYLDERKETVKRKQQIFRTLMATRSYNLNWDHVRALNLIDIEFNRDNRREKRVIEAWKAYLDLLNNKSMNENSWNEKRVELLVDLLHQMSKCLDFDFDKTHIKNSSYSPIAHGEADFKQKQIIDGAIEILEGRRDLSIVIKNIEKNDAT